MTWEQDDWLVIERDPVDIETRHLAFDADTTNEFDDRLDDLTDALHRLPGVERARRTANDRITVVGAIDGDDALQAYVEQWWDARPRPPEDVEAH